MAKNGKANGSKTKANGKTGEKKPRQKKDKPTVEAMSDQERQRLAFALSRDLAAADLVKKDAADARKGIVEKIKGSGFTVKQIDLLNELKTGEGQEAFKLFTQQTAEVVRWSGVGVQLGLFGDQRVSKAERYFEDGRRAAFDGQPRKPPDHLAQKDAQKWMEGYNIGITAANTDRAAGFKPLGDVASSIAKVPPVGDDFPAGPAPIGSEPTSHMPV